MPDDASTGKPTCERSSQSPPADAAGGKKDFFISHSGKDSKWAEWIAWTLEEAGYTVVLDIWDFGAGSDFIQQMNDGLVRAERMIAVISKAYFDSLYTHPEWTAVFTQDPKGDKGMLVPVRIEKFDLPPLFAPRIYIDLADADEKAAEHKLLALVRGDRRKPLVKPRFPSGAVRRESIFPPSLPRGWNVPGKNRNFTGRDRVLKKLRKTLLAGKRTALTAIHGLGGIGKTEIAVEYAHRHAGDYDLVWWVAAEKAPTLASEYGALAEELDLVQSAQTDQKTKIAAVDRWLEENDGWLLVFDNAVKAEDIEAYLPDAPHGHIIVTSRNHDWRGLADEISIDLWTETESVRFIIARTGRKDREAAKVLAKRLGFLPLALAQAAAYIVATGCSTGDYVTMLEGRSAEMLQDSGHTAARYKRTIAETWGASFEKIEERSSDAVELLKLMAFLGPDEVPISLFTGGEKCFSDDSKPYFSESGQFHNAVEPLLEFSLVKADGRTLSIHRLVQEVLRARMADDEERTWASAALLLFTPVFWGDVVTDVERWALLDVSLPHALAAADHCERLKVEEKNVAWLLNQAGVHSETRADYTRAKSLYERALAIDEAAYGPDDPRLAIRLNKLGGVLESLGDYTGAKSHFERALAMDEAAYGPDDPAVARDLNNLGELFRRLGEYKRAKALDERALAILERAHGEEHPHVATTANNLGLVLRALGDYKGAKSLFERAIAIGEKTLGPDHPDVAKRVNNLGCVLFDSGDIEEARDHFERALAVRLAAFGEMHPDVAQSLFNLAVLFKHMGDTDKAHENCRRALDIRVKMLGDEHPDTIEAAELLARLDAS